MKPLVSIIIPAYKVEQYIFEALRSIQAQTYPHWEAIVIEDGSQDETESIVRAFALDLENNVLYDRLAQNQGPSAARNLGLSKAQGKYIAFLDADDLWKEHHLEKAIDALESDKGDIIYSTVQKFNSTTGEFLGRYGPTEEDLKNFPESLFTRVTNYIQPSTIVMKREIVDAVGLFDLALLRVEDRDYIIRIAAAKFRFFHLDEITCLLRRGHSSAVSSQRLMQECRALVFRKHNKLEVIKPKIRNNCVFITHLTVAKNCFSVEPLKAADFLFWAWRAKPTKIKYLGIIAVAYIYSLILDTGVLSMHFKQQEG